MDLKKVRYNLHKFDGLWSVPLAFFAFWIIGLILTEVFGFAAGTYDPGFVQPLFLSTIIVIGATNFGVLGVYFTLRGFHRFLYGQRDPNGGIINYSKLKWKVLQPWQMFVFSLGSLFYFITAILIVYLHLI